MEQHAIDIVVPTFRLNEQVLLGIINLPTPPGFTVFTYIVSDNPQVKVPDSIRQLNEEGAIQLLINEQNLGAPATRNVGIGAGKNKWILFLDDDIMPQPNLLTSYADAIQQNEDVIGFAGVTHFPKPFNAVTSALQIHGTVDSFTEPERKSTVVWSPTANVMLNRGKMDDSLFDASLVNAEDIDFLTRNSLLYKERYVSVPDAVVAHPWWNNGKVQTRRMISYGTGASQIARKHPIRQYTYRDFTNTLETLLLLLFVYPFAWWNGFGYIIIAFIIAVLLAEYLSNWIRGIIKGKAYSPVTAFHLMWIKNCWEFGFLYTSLSQGYFNGFAQRIEMGFNKPHPSPFRLNRWKIIKMVLISIVSWLILWGRT